MSKPLTLKSSLVIFVPLMAISFYLGMFAESSDIDSEIKNLQNQISQTNTIINEMREDISISSLVQQAAPSMTNENNDVVNPPIIIERDSNELTELTERVAYLESNNGKTHDPYTQKGSPTPESLH
jgi:hypothetical protein